MKNQSQNHDQSSWKLESKVSDYDEFNQGCVKRINKALDAVDFALLLTTGHDPYSRRKIAYYAVATYFLRDFDPFPGMVIYGAPSTGKTMTLNVLKGCCNKSFSITGETITAAALRSCMNQANEGTLVIEESDSMTVLGLEEILITRYSRSSGENTKMVPDGHKGWEAASYATFGATIAHRRNLFRDPAMLRRVITVKTKRTKQGYFEKDIDTLNCLCKVFHKQMTHHPKLPCVANVWNIEPGIFDCYKPLVVIADFLDDTDFLEQLIAEMREASDRLREEETYLEPQILLKALINLTSGKVKDKINANLLNVPICDIEPALREEFGSSCPVLKLSANQRNRIIRDDFGFEIKSSHGRNRVYFTIPMLIEACQNHLIEDECLDEWKKILS